MPFAACAAIVSPMRELRSEIDIAAPPERVWAVLTKFEAYPEWNPFMRSVVGSCETGSRLTVRIEPPGARGMTFEPTILSAEPRRELRWLGRLLVPGLFDGEHRLSIEPLNGGGARFVQSERFSGLLVGLFAKTLAATQRGFEQMNVALKRRVEEAE
jgi:hypothetical protein